jgi:shikimate dehydrogenase
MFSRTRKKEARMPGSIPTLCGSFAARPSKVGVAYHNAAYRALGLEYAYVAFRVEDAGDAVQAMRALGMRGAGVTMPHKEAVIAHLDKMDPAAAEMKSVNTIVNDDGVLTGYNFDWSAAKQALEEATALDGKEAVVVGAGGASRAIVYALARSGARVRVYNRTLAKAAALVAEFGLAAAHPLDTLPQVGAYDILVNATAVGYHRLGETIIAADLIRPEAVVFDVVAEPLETTLLAEARARGAWTVAGHRMRLLQAAEQFRMYTGVAPPLDVMQEALLAASRPARG